MAVPQLAGAEDVAWNLVIDLANARMPTWVLAGGLMVHLHLYEAGVSPRRATTDVDAIVDVNLRVARAGPAAFASRLVEEFGMHVQVAPGLDAARGHRFTREDGGTIDVLAPDRWERPDRTTPSHRPRPSRYPAAENCCATAPWSRSATAADRLRFPARPS